MSKIDSASKKYIFITGGTRGIGRAIVEKFCSRGHAVAFTYKRSDKLARDVANSTGALALKADCFDWEQTRQAVKSAKTYFGIKACDVLIANAGIASDKLVTDYSPEDVEEIIGVNLKGQIYASKAALPDMISKKSGTIVLISSIWGIQGASCETIYSASKAGIIGFCKSLAKEVAPSCIRVNAVAPGVIDTSMNSCYTNDDLLDLAKRTPMLRLGKPSEVADAVYYLASDEASFITGQILTVDGGFSV